MLTTLYISQFPDELRPKPRSIRRFVAPPATRSRDTYLSAQYRRLKPRRGHTRAIGAVRHSIIVACWHMLTTGETYRDAGGDYFTRLDPAKQSRRLIAQLERLGYAVTLQEAAA